MPAPALGEAVRECRSGESSPPSSSGGGLWWGEAGWRFCELPNGPWRKLMPLMNDIGETSRRAGESLGERELGVPGVAGQHL